MSLQARGLRQVAWLGDGAGGTAPRRPPGCGREVREPGLLLHVFTLVPMKLDVMSSHRFPHSDIFVICFHRFVHEPGLLHFSARFLRGLVVSASLRNTCCSSYRGNDTLRKSSTTNVQKMSYSIHVCMYIAISLSLYIYVYIYMCIYIYIHTYIRIFKILAREIS